MKNFLFAEHRLIGFAEVEKPKVPQVEESKDGAKAVEKGDLEQKTAQLEAKIARVRAMSGSLNPEKKKEWETNVNDRIDTINKKIGEGKVDVIDSIDKCLEQIDILLRWQDKQNIDVVRKGDEVTVTVPTSRDKNPTQVCVVGGNGPRSIQFVQTTSEGLQWKINTPANSGAKAAVHFSDGTVLTVGIEASGQFMKKQGGEFKVGTVDLEKATEKSALKIAYQIRDAINNGDQKNSMEVQNLLAELSEMIAVFRRKGGTEMEKGRVIGEQIVQQFEPIVNKEGKPSYTLEFNENGFRLEEIKTEAKSEKKVGVEKKDQVQENVNRAVELELQKGTERKIEQSSTKEWKIIEDGIVDKEGKMFIYKKDIQTRGEKKTMIFGFTPSVGLWVVEQGKTDWKKIPDDSSILNELNTTIAILTSVYETRIKALKTEGKNQEQYEKMLKQNKNNTLYEGVLRNSAKPSQFKVEDPRWEGHERARNNILQATYNSEKDVGPQRKQKGEEYLKRVPSMTQTSSGEYEYDADGTTEYYFKFNDTAKTWEWHYEDDADIHSTTKVPVDKNPGDRTLQATDAAMPKGYYMDLNDTGVKQARSVIHALDIINRSGEKKIK